MLDVAKRWIRSRFACTSDKGSGLMVRFQRLRVQGSGFGVVVAILHAQQAGHTVRDAGFVSPRIRVARDHIHTTRGHKINWVIQVDF